MSEAKRTEKYLLYSLFVHVAIFALFFLSTRLFPNTAKLYLPSIQVDMVALPNNVKTDSNQTVDTALPIKDKVPPPPEKPKPEPIPEKSVVVPKIKPTKTKDPEVAAESAIEKLRREVNKEKQEEQKKQKEELKQFQERYRAANRGNQLHEGTNMSGSMEATLNAYAAHITDRLRSNWTIPVWLQSEKLRAAVRIYIDARGNIVNYQFIQKSGNQTFDDCVKAAIERSSPFAPPPAEMSSGLRSSGMEVLFPI